MSQVLNYNGDNELYHWGPIYTNREEPNRFLSLGRHMDAYFPLCKKPHVSAPFGFGEDRFEQKMHTSIEILPDECLLEILKRVSDGQEKSSCACVSKRWLMLLSDIRRDDLCNIETISSTVPETALNLDRKDASFWSQINREKLSSGYEKSVDPTQDLENGIDGYLSRCLEGKRASDVRLAAAAVGTASRGGLEKLTIRGNKSTRVLTNMGLRAIARGCPSLKVLSLWNAPFIGDDGLIEIANGCHLLEKLELCRCPSITDKSLAVIVKNCPYLDTITLESCPNIGNESLRDIGQCCANLRSISINGCPLIGDQGIVSLFSSASCALTNVKLQALNVTDVSLAIIGHYGKAVTDLFLAGLQNVSEKGFWVMGHGHGLQLLKSFTTVSCQGVTGIGLEAIAKGSPSLKQLRLRKCAVLSDACMLSLAKAAQSLESLQLEECHKITQSGLFAYLINSGPILTAFSMVKCYGIKDQNLGSQKCASPCQWLRSLTIRNCPGFGDASMDLIGKLCPQLRNLDLSGSCGLTDDGILPLIQFIDTGFLNVNLSNCVNITGKVVTTLADGHGWTLEVLNVGGCGKIKDASMKAIADNCFQLIDLDVSKSAITDVGIAHLACSRLLNLQILSVSGCGLLSDRSLPYFKKMSNIIMDLNLQHCGRISASKVGRLAEALWDCDILI